MGNFILFILILFLLMFKYLEIYYSIPILIGSSILATALFLYVVHALKRGAIKEGPEAEWER